MSHYHRPTSLVRCGHFRVLTYQACAFIPQDPNSGGNVLQREADKPSCGSTLTLGILAAVLFLTVLLLGTAAAQADPSNAGNQATFIRFGNSISFGAVQRTQTREDAHLALARLAAFINRDRSKRSQKQDALPTIAKAFQR